MLKVVEVVILVLLRLRLQVKEEGVLMVMVVQLVIQILLLVHGMVRFILHIKDHKEEKVERLIKLQDQVILFISLPVLAQISL